MVRRGGQAGWSAGRAHVDVVGLGTVIMRTSSSGRDGEAGAPRAPWLAQVIGALHQFARDDEVPGWRFVLVLVFLGAVIGVPLARLLFL